MAIDGQVPRMRSLGLPLTAGHVSVFSLFLMPLGAFQPHDQLYVYEEDGRLAGLARVERDAHRDEWTVVELDAVDNGDAGDIRYRLVQHLLRDGSRRGAARFHVACADRGGNVELFMQAGFARYGEESVLYRDPDVPFPSVRSVDPAAAGIRPALPNDAIALDRLYRTVTPAPVARLEDYRIPDWEHIGSRAGVPRTSLTPLLRFADLEAFVQETGGGPSGDGLVAFLHLGVAKEHQPHYLRVVTRARPRPHRPHPLRPRDDRRAGGWRACAPDPRPRTRRDVVRPHVRGSARPAPRGAGPERCSLDLPVDERGTRAGRRARHGAGHPLSPRSTPRPDPDPPEGGDGMTQPASTPDESENVPPQQAPEAYDDDLDALLDALPPEIRDRLRALPDLDSVIEVVMDLGRRPEARFGSGGEEVLSESEIDEDDIALRRRPRGLVRRRQPRRHRADVAPHLRDPQSAAARSSG